MSFNNRLMLLTFILTTCLSVSLKAQDKIGNNITPKSINTNWWLGSENDSLKALGVYKTRDYVMSLNIKPRKTITTAIIDGGFDVTHPYFAAGIDKVEWDSAQWNFLGNKDGKVISRTGTESFRYFKKLYPKYKDITDNNVATKDTAEYKFFKQITREARINSYLMYAKNMEYTYNAMARMDSVLKVQFPDSALTLNDFYHLEMPDTTGYGLDILLTQNQLLRYNINSPTLVEQKVDAPWDSIFSHTKVAYELSKSRVESLSRTDDDPHELIGNHPDDFSDLTYGNNLIDSDAYHGTMVAGLVTLMQQQMGSTPHILPIRAIPDGDEYDRDVTAALIWAVNHGAKVVNMSFGKDRSPRREEVDKALKLAEEKDVLLIIAAGNSKRDNDTKEMFPRTVDVNGKHWSHIVCVGATDEQGHISEQSCWGKNTVDVMAPGFNITSVKAGGQWDTQNGTSLACPIVAGLASAIRSYFPDLSAQEVREVLISTVNKNGNLTDRCISGGIINPLSAFRIAYEKSRYGSGALERARAISADSISGLIRNNSAKVKWLDKEGKYVLFEVEGKADSLNTHYLFDVKKRLRTKLFVNTDLYRILTPYARQDRLPMQGKVYINEHKIDEKGNNLMFVFNGHNLKYNIVGKSISEVEMKEDVPTQRRSSGEYGKNYSKDSLYCVTCWGHNLFLYDIQKGDTVQLTNDGEHFYSFSVTGSGNYASPDTARKMNAPIGSWVGDSHIYVLIREDKRKVETMTIVKGLSEPRPEVSTYKFPMPSDTIVSQYELYVLDADSRKMKQLEVSAYKDQMLETPRFGRMIQSGDNIYFLRKSRYQDTLDLCCVDAKTQNLRVLIHEDCTPHLNEQLFSFHVLDGGKNIIWWSERSGKGQYFLYDGNGKLRNAITPHDMVAGPIEHIDTISSTIFFKGYGREKNICPTYAYHYRVSLNGKGFVCLTTEKGNHDVQFNESHTLLVDECSMIDKAPVHRLYDNKGNMLTIISEADISPLLQKGWKAPQAMEVVAADGKTPLYGVVYTPSWMEADDKLPIISNPYPGPQDDLVPKSFIMDDNGNQTLADMGFVVIAFSYRGSNPLRGREFYTHGYQNLRDYAIDDDMATIRQVASLIPQADTTKVGIYGHSGGGFMAATAMMLHPEFYKVGIAASGNYDNNIYTKWWGESFHGRGRIPTTIELAKNLKGKLMLVTGEVDNNVHPAHTMRLADALIKAKKHFDMFVLPGVDHGVGGSYYEAKVRDYFIKNLK